MTEFPRLSIHISPDTDAFLREQRRAGISVTATVRRAIAVYKFLLDETRDGGKFMVYKDGEARDVIFLP